jgi:hypothetical protein
MQIFLDEGYIKFLPASISQIVMSSTAYDVNPTSALKEEMLIPKQNDKGITATVDTIALLFMTN